MLPQTVYRSVSIHAPTPRGGGAAAAPALGPSPQSTPPLGDDAGFSNPRPNHAPPVGGRRLTSNVVAGPRCFNPRPPRGATCGVQLASHGSSSFNPRPPRGGDSIRAWIMPARARQFRSTPPARGRPFPAPRHGAGMGVSIHAPPRGATLARDASDLAHAFQSTPPRGRRLRMPTCRPARKFQSTPPRGATGGGIGTGQGRL